MSAHPWTHDHADLLAALPEAARDSVAAYAFMLYALRLAAEMSGICDVGQASGTIRTMALADVFGADGTAQIDELLAAAGTGIRLVSYSTSDDPIRAVLPLLAPVWAVIVPLADHEQIAAAFRVANAISEREIADWRAELDESDEH